jgi:anaerobic selenocysteine-containing dehydrogenase
MMNNEDKKISSRRSFLAGGALLGTGLLVSVPKALAAPARGGANAVMNSDRPDAPYELVKPTNMIYSACLQCNTGCGITCKQQNGVITSCSNPTIRGHCRLICLTTPFRKTPPG